MKYLGSEHFSLSKWDLGKIAKGAAIAGLAAACTWLIDQAIPWLQSQPEVNLTVVAILSVVINAVRKWATDTTVVMFLWLLAFGLIVPAAAEAQIQIMPEAKLETLRRALPATEGDAWQEFFFDPATLFYTEAEMPKAYQHADAGLIVNMGFGPFGGTSRQTTFHWALNNISGDARESSKGEGFGGNGNVEFPWRTPGGNDPAEQDTNSFKMMLLPPRGDGTRWPVVFYQTTLHGSRMGAHSGYAWIFPVGTLFGEALVLRDSQGVLHTYEVRIRKREPEFWDIDVLRPFPEAKDLAARLQEIDPARYSAEIDHLTTAVHLQPEALFDEFHPTSLGFQAVAARDPLPILGEDLAKYLLDSTPFKQSIGAAWREAPNGVRAFAPTTDEPFSIVPRGYLGTWLGTDTETCAKCHESTLKHVDEFDRQRDWYGYVRGSADGIFSFHPIAIQSISPNGVPRRVQLRPEFVQAGIVEIFDRARHPAEIYRLLKQ